MRLFPTFMVVVGDWGLAFEGSGGLFAGFWGIGVGLLCLVGVWGLEWLFWAGGIGTLTLAGIVGVSCLVYLGLGFL